MARKKKKNSDTKLRNVRRSKYDVKKYATAGMYTDNTVANAGQGNSNVTANIVFDENDPNKLDERINFLNTTKQNLINESKNVTEEIKNQDDIDQQNITDAVNQTQSGDAIVGGTVKTIEQSAEDLGLVKEKQSLKDKFGITKITDAYKGTKAANLASKATEFDASIGMDVLKSGDAADKIAKTLPEGFQVMSDATTGKTIILDQAGNVVKQGSAIGRAAGAAVKNPNVLALAAQYGGKGIKALADDGDEKTWTFGEASGDVLSKAGEYAGYGATLGSFVPGIGNVVGAGIGATIGTGVGIYQGLTGRNKARRLDTIAQQNKRQKVKEFNKEARTGVLSALASTRAQEIKNKTYSGYDLGRNVTARNGGYRLGMPRYGNA